MNESVYVVAGTGPRRLQTAPAATKRAAFDLAVEAIGDYQQAVGDHLVIMSGMAEGWDACLARAALHCGARLWAAIPHQGYAAYYWGRASVTGQNRVAEFHSIVAAAWRVTHVIEDIHGQTGIYLDGEHSNKVRNRWMVEQANEFLVWNPATGGTKHCFDEVRRAGLPWRDLSKQAVPL